MRTDVYQKITDQIVTAKEQGVRSWHQPWKAEHGARRITRPLRSNGTPYQGINVLMLWWAALEKGYAAPIWMTFKQALDLKAHVRKGEHGSLVVYADKIFRAETDAKTGEEGERAIPFMKGYTVFNVEQIEGLPEHYYGKPQASLGSIELIEHAESFLAATGANVVHGGSRACYVPSTDNIHMPCIDFFRDAVSYYYACGFMRPSIGPGTKAASTASLAVSGLGMKATRWRSWSRNLAQLSCPPISPLLPKCARITSPISALGSRH